MRHRIWLLALVVAAGLACAREEVSDTSPSAAPATPTPPPNYTLMVTFEGLVGYLNQNDHVWALLPKARADTMPVGFDPNNLHDYPEHYAFLKVNGENVKDFGIPGEILIPIDGKEIQVTDQFGTGDGIPSTEFRQPTAAADKLYPDVLNSNYSKLATRVKLPLIAEADWIIDVTESGQTPKFINVYPVQKNSYCEAAQYTAPDYPRVQAVTWQMKDLTGEVTLNLSTLGGAAVPPLVLAPVNGQSTIQVWIVNKEWQALHDPDYVAPHWPAYRWFYNLSVEQSDCTKHYYPQGQLGGNRCPQKLYPE